MKKILLLILLFIFISVGSSMAGTRVHVSVSWGGVVVIGGVATYFFIGASRQITKKENDNKYAYNEYSYINDGIDYRSDDRYENSFSPKPSLPDAHMNLFNKSF